MPDKEKKYDDAWAQRINALYQFGMPGMNAVFLAVVIFLVFQRDDGLIEKIFNENKQQSEMMREFVSTGNELEKELHEIEMAILKALEKSK